MNRTLSSRLLPLIFLLLSFTLLNAQLGRLDSLYCGNMGLGGAVLGGFVQPDSSIIIYGQFANCNERVISSIAKLKQDGSNDYTFNVGTSTGSSPHYVTAVARQSDGKLIVGGGFQVFNGTSEFDIVRLNTNGSVDTSFHGGSLNIGAIVYAINIQPSGSIIIAGTFNNVGGHSVGGIARITSGGYYDTTFHAGTGANSGIMAMIAEANGQIVIGGSFTKYNGVVDSGVARLNTDGSLDTTFSLQRGPGSGKNIYALGLTPGGKILVGGNFTTWAGQTANYITRLNSNGTWDSGFSGGTGFNSYVYSIVTQTNGEVIIGGQFTTYKGSTVDNILRMDTSGNVDGTFSTVTDINEGNGGIVNGIFLNYDGRVFAGGSFSMVDSFARHNLVRLQTNGTVDQSFFYNSHMNLTVYAIVTQSTGKVILGGAFTKYNDVNVGHILRLNTDGSLDTSFHDGTGANGTVYALALTSGGQILVGGQFTQFNGHTANDMLRLNSDGSYDNTFTNNTISTNSSFCFAQDKIGRIYAGGYFNTVNGVGHGEIARFSANGVYDNTFNPLLTGSVSCIAIQPDSKIIIVGGFTKCNNISAQGICRVDTLGNIDTATFHALGQTGGTAIEIASVSLQPDGKILIGSPFMTSFNGTTSTFCARINSNGSIDSSFVANIGGTGGAESIAYYNGGALVAGNIPSINGVTESDIDLVDTFGNPNALGYSNYDATYSVSAAQPFTLVYPDTVNGRILGCGAGFTTTGQYSSYFQAIIGAPTTSVGVDSVSILAPVCASGTTKVYFKNEKSFNKGNVFTAQLSDSSGNFGSPVNIGTQTAGSTGWDSVSVTIPGTVYHSNHYRVRMTSTNPVYTSASSAYFTIGPWLDTLTTSGATTFCQGGSVVLTSKTAGTYNWSNSSSSQTLTATTSGTYTVTATTNNCSATASMAVTVNTNPTATAVNSGPYCSYANISLTAGVSGLTSYSWSGPNSFASASQSPTLAASGNGGTYTITVTNSNGCTASASTTVTVNTPATATASNSGPYCSYGAIGLTAGPGSMTSYSWSGPNSFSSGAQSPTRAASGNGGTYTVTITDGNSCTASAATSVIVNTIPSATASNGGPYCSYGTISLTGGVNGLTTYNWSGPNSYSSTSQNPTLSASGNGGTYTLTVTDGNGCTASTATSVAVNTAPVATATNGGPYCSYSTISLTGGTNGLTAYSWSGPNSYTSTTQNPTLSASGNAGSYSLTVTDANGCSSSASTNVAVNAAPMAMATNGGPYCSYNTIALTGVSSGLTSYNWSGPNSFTSSSQDTTTAASGNSGSYNLTVTDYNGCTASATTTVIVNTAPVATAPDTGVYNYYDTISLTSAPGGLASYVWSGPHSFSASTQNATLLAEGNAGSYSVTVTDANGCTSSATTTVIVIEDSLAISVGTITGSPFCAGATISIPFTARGDFDSSNIFTAQLSDSSGNFFYPVTIGVLASNVSGTITGIIPFNLTGGTNYQVMVIASDSLYSDSIYNGYSASFAVNSIGVPNNIGSYSICSDSAYTFAFDSITPGNGGNKIQWSADSTFSGFSYIASGANDSITVAAGSDSIIWVRSIDSVSGCFSQPEKVIVQVNRNPVDTASNTGPYCYEGTIALSATPANLMNYVWSGPDSTFNPITASTTLAAAGNAGTYTVTVTDFNGCTATASTTVSVNAPMVPPTIPVSQSACSDTALTFTFIDTLGSSGNQLEWATNSMFLNSQVASSPDTLTFSVGAGGTITVYIQSSDSTTGCTSVPVTATATVYALPFPLTPTVSLDTICPTSSTNILIPNSENGKNYLLQVGGSTIATGSGNGFTLSISTGSVDSNTTYTVMAIDTLSGCYRPLQPSITVYVDSVISAPAFTTGDTILYTDETIQYTAANLSSSTISYFIDTGSASIDSVSGWVSSVGSSFIVEAVTAPVPGCHVATAYLPVTFISTPQTAPLPVSQIAWSDTPVTFVLSNILPGRGATQVEWSLDSTFATYTLITDSGSITLTVDTSSTDTVYMRSREELVERTDVRFYVSGITKTTLSVKPLPNGVNGLSSTFVTYVNLTPPDINTSNAVGITPASNSATPSGGLAYTVPIACPPGTNGMTPQISLTYNSQGSSGMLGWGWGLSGLSTISRTGFDNFHDQQVSAIGFNATGPFSLDGTRLTASSSGTNTYVKEADDFSTTEAMDIAEGNPGWFQVTTKQGTIMEYGHTTDSRFVTITGGNILQWKIDKITDRDGNFMTFTYDNSDGSPRIVEIDYTGNVNQGTATYAAMFFNYVVRTVDNNTTYTAGTPSYNKHLLSSIVSQVNGVSTIFKKYSLAYTNDGLNTELASITEFGTDGTNLNPMVFQYGAVPNYSNYTAISSSFDKANGVVAGINEGTTITYRTAGFNTSSATPMEISGDFNGDGYSDMLVLYQATSPAAVAAGETTPYNMAFAVNFMDPATQNFAKKNEVDHAYNDATFTPSTETSLTGTPGYASDHENYDYFVGDFLGLGRDGILEIQKKCVGGTLTIAGIKYYSFDQTGYCTVTTIALPTTTTIPANTGYISVGDFDGDGRLDYILYNTSSTTISFPSKNIFNANAYVPATEFGKVGSYYFPGAGLYYQNMNSFVINFEGDGKSDILAVTPSNSYVYVFDYATSQSTGTYTFDLKYTLTYPNLNDADQFYFGDFNGDGKTDIITHHVSNYTTAGPGKQQIPQGTSYGSPLNPTLIVPVAGLTSVTNAWNIGYATGTSFNEITTPFLYNSFGASNCSEVKNGGQCYNAYGEVIPYGIFTSTVSGQTTSYATEADYTNALNMAQGLVVGDFNGDGKSDVLYNFTRIAQSGTALGYISCASSTMFYSTGAGFTPNTIFEKMGSLNLQNIVTGDFNGDGRNDVAYYNTGTNIECNTLPASSVDNSDDDDYFQFSFNAFGQERLIQQSTDAFGQNRFFVYQPLTNPAIYKPGYTNWVAPPASLPATGYNPNPVTSAGMSMYSLSSATAPDGIGGTHTTTYTYTNALVHHAGRGFIGFQSQSSYSNALNITTNTSYNYAYPYYTPTTVLTTTAVGGTQLSVDNSSYSQNYVGTNHYTVQKVAELTNNEITGASNQTNYTYDNYGNVTVANSTVNGSLESTTVTTTYVGSPVPAWPSTVIVNKTRQGAPAYSNSVTNWYNGSWHLEAKTPSQSCGVTSSYQYDGYGNVSQQYSYATTTSGASRSQSFDYSSLYNGRFPLEVTNSLSQTTAIGYDLNFGKPTVVVGIDGNTTTCTYDGYGRVISTVPPRGSSNTITTSYAWDINNNGLNSIYSVTTTQPHKPEVIVWYDAMGREVQRKTMGFNSNWLTSSVTYTNLNKPATVTNAHYEGESPSFKTYTYDYLNRVTNVLDQFTNNTTIGYVCGSGNTQVTTTDAAGHYSVQTTDAAGKLVSAKDNAGTLKFSYDSYGNKIKVSGPSGVTFIKYDLCNHKTEVDEPNTGTFTYQYDGYGQLLQQVENGSKTFNMQYDVLGRLTQQSGTDGTSSYTYNGTGANGVDKLASVTGFSGIQQSYTYDAYSDVTAVSEVINSNTYTTTTNYDAYGIQTNTIYPSTLQINYAHDGNGYLTKICEEGGPTLYTANTMNSYGQATSYTLGNGITSTLTSNFGVPTNYATTSSTLQSLALTYDWASGDLTKRQDNTTSNLYESFTYDASDRLTSAQVNGSAVMNYGFDGKGNITSKDDVGSYDYDETKLNQVVHVSNTPGNISNNTQNITYIGFNKAAMITENGYELDYYYASDYSRKYSVLKSGGTTVNTRVYCGNYEENDSVASGNNQKLHYIYGNNGLVAIIVIDNSGKSEYYTYTDQLGSILTVTNSSATVVAQQNFDAWGRNRNPVNWSYSSVPGVPNWLYRGYSGHEMLPQFALINMNGRMYDPLLGRMLSPDNGVQFPNSTQSYNMFSYCGNNPLKYTDPTGWKKDLFAFPAWKPSQVIVGDGGPPIVDNSAAYAAWQQRVAAEYPSTTETVSDGGAIAALQNAAGAYFNTALMQNLATLLQGQIEAALLSGGDQADINGVINQYTSAAVAQAGQYIANQPPLPIFGGLGDGESVNILNFINNGVITLASAGSAIISFIMSHDELAAEVAEFSTTAGWAGVGASFIEIGNSLLKKRGISGTDVLDLGANILATAIGTINPVATFGAGLWGGLEYVSYATTRNNIFTNAQMLIDNANYWNSYTE